MNLAIENYLSGLHADEATPEDILVWAWKTFAPRVVASSSFQTQSVPLLHMISRVCPEMPVIFIDTGFHFPETLEFRELLQAHLGLNIVIAQPELSKNDFVLEYGEELYRRDPDLCCQINKVRPLQCALDGMSAWVTGVRHDQTKNRSSLHDLETQISGVIKIHPLLRWDRAQVEEYRRHYDLPAHPLYEAGYLSVGCMPCTQPVLDVGDVRAGRWAGTGKRECGLHLDG
ncbi:MAG: phosphoadenylyl-sulfate reductase [Anaerolineae bacterium]|nr:phosphoadenylyl-sulfate reductase [Anaerolineae bacterium]